MTKIIYEKIIKGIPTGRFKNRGNTSLVKNWRSKIIQETQDGIGKVKNECKMKVVFKFDTLQYPKDFPYGPDLDNQIKNLWDGLNETVFKNVPGHDSCVRILHVSKYPAKNENDTGVIIKISDI